MGNRERVAVVLGIVALVAALVLLVTPVSSQQLDCGSVVKPRNEDHLVLLQQSGSEASVVVSNPDCPEARKDRLVPGVVLGVAGSAGVLWGLWRSRTESGEPAEVITLAEP